MSPQAPQGRAYAAAPAPRHNRCGSAVQRAPEAHLAPKLGHRKCGRHSVFCRPHLYPLTLTCSDNHTAYTELLYEPCVTGRGGRPWRIAFTLDEGVLTLDEGLSPLMKEFPPLTKSAFGRRPHPCGTRPHPCGRSRSS